MVIPTPLGAVSIRWPFHLFPRCRHCGAPAHRFRVRHLDPLFSRRRSAHLYGEAHCAAPCPITWRCDCIPCDDEDCD